MAEHKTCRPDASLMEGNRSAVLIRSAVEDSNSRTDLSDESDFKTSNRTASARTDGTSRTEHKHEETPPPVQAECFFPGGRRRSDEVR